jgi:uncharacterized protein (TIGR02118 family)
MSVSRHAFLSTGIAGAAVAFAAQPVIAEDSLGATILALYKRPPDTNAFNTYYTKHHAPLAKTMPGLQSYTLSNALGDKDPYYLVATLTFSSMTALKDALASSQGKAVVADLKNFAQAGVDILTFENVRA